jgi:hypothetical protein
MGRTGRGYGHLNFSCLICFRLRLSADFLTRKVVKVGESAVMEGAVFVVRLKYFTAISFE